LACPYFVPREIVYDISWQHPARLPLGAGWTGTCCAPHEQAAAPDNPIPKPVDAATLRDLCNLGYAATCPHLPKTRDWDAVKFSVASRTNDQITLAYVCEFAYAPRAHGKLTYDLAAETWLDTPGATADPRVRRLAASYLQAYRVRQSPSLI
jgi:hypothetical protein